MTVQREYPERPLVGVGGVVIADGRALLIRRGGPPLEGEWSIPGGMLELGETIVEGVRRELAEETGLEVRVLDLIEVFERISPDEGGKAQYHFVVLDYLCEAVERRGAAPEATRRKWRGSREEELAEYSLTTSGDAVIQKAFEMAARSADMPTEVAAS